MYTLIIPHVPSAAPCRHELSNMSSFLCLITATPCSCDPLPLQWHCHCWLFNGTDTAGVTAQVRRLTHLVHTQPDGNAVAWYLVALVSLQQVGAGECG